MLFPSLTFLFVFLPIILAIYYLTPRIYRNYILLIFSILFYAWGGVTYTIVLVASITINILFAKRLEKKMADKKRWLIIGLTFNVLVIFIFKYLDFFIENINFLGEFIGEAYRPIPIQGIVLPLGISFFTFQQMSFLWDIYSNPLAEKVNPLYTSLYISFFPQLIAGPIVRYNDIIDQIKTRYESLELFQSGIQRFIIGLFKKVVLADVCGLMADEIINQSVDNISTPTAWLGICGYAFQIYFDFSGYSDMAIGLGRMFGFKILENFNFPYLARSIKEFWSRWHMSLSSWFRDYVYIPLGGNRNGEGRTYRNLLIVFLLTGFWHGATWSFVLWGLFHGLFLVIEKLGWGKILNKLPKIVGSIYCLLVVLIGWVFFRIENISEAFDFTKRLFGFGAENNDIFPHYLNKERILVLSIAFLSSTTLFLKLKNQLSSFFKARYFPFGISRDLVLIAMFVYIVMVINTSSYSPFIYFRF